MPSCFICNSQGMFPDEISSYLEDDGIISLGYGSKYDGEYLFPMSNWYIQKLKAWEIINSPNKKIPICDTCIDNLINENHISKRELYKDNPTIRKYEVVPSYKYHVCISFEDLLTDLTYIDIDIFYPFNIEVNYISRKEISLSQFKLKENNTKEYITEYKLHPNEFIIIDSSGEKIGIIGNNLKEFNNYHKKY